MSDDRYDIKLLGFPQESGDPVEALHQAFGFSRNRAIALLQRLPVVVKRNATAQEVAQFLHAFSAIGASATVLKGGEQAISSPPGSVELPPERPTVPVTPVEQAALDRFTPFEPATEKPAVPPEPTEDKARAPLVIDRLDDEVPVVSVRPSGEIELIDLPTPEDLPPEVPVVSVRPSGEIELIDLPTPEDLPPEVPVVSVRPSGEIELIDLPTPEDLPPEVPVVSVRPSGEIELAEHWTPGLRGEKSAVPVELPDREEEALSDRKVENVESQRVVRTKSTRWGAQQLFSAEVAGTPSAPRTSAPSIESAPEGGPLARKGVPIPRTAARSSVGKPPLEPDAPASLDLAAPDAAEPTLPSAPPEQAGPSGSNGDPFSSLLPEDKMLLEELFSSATLSPGSCQVEQLEERPSGGDVSPVLAPLDSAMGFWAPEQTGAPAAEPPEIQATDAIEEEHFELSPTGDEEERLSVEPALSEPRSSAGEAETEGGGSTPWMTVLRGEEGSAEGVRGERRHITAARVIVTSQKGGRGELSRRSKFLFFGGLLLVAVLVIVPLMFGRGMSEDLQEALARTQQSQLPGFEPLSSQRGEIQPQQRKSLDLQTRPGFCYGWIATTSRGAFCDLNLRLYGPGILFSQSTGPDSTPVVFHCATEGIRLQAELENVGPGRCAYGMKSYQRRASVAWPLEPYLDLYSRSLGLSRSGTRWIASSEINHIHMASGERINRAVILPAQDCSYFVAASQQGTNLNLYLRIDGAVVSRSTANNHVAVVSACALDRDLLGELELALVRGESDLVWQSYLGDPPQRR